MAQLRSLAAEINGSSHGERAKPAELGLEERDIADAVKWARELPATKTARKK